jgi:hypothetical protein
MKVGDLVECLSLENKILWEKGIITHCYENKKTGESTYWVWLQESKFRHEFFYEELTLLSEA